MRVVRFLVLLILCELVLGVRQDKRKSMFSWPEQSFKRMGKMLEWNRKENHVTYTLDLPMLPVFIHIRIFLCRFYIMRIFLRCNHNWETNGGLTGMSSQSLQDPALLQHSVDPEEVVISNLQSFGDSGSNPAASITSFGVSTPLDPLNSNFVDVIDPEGDNGLPEGVVDLLDGSARVSYEDVPRNLEGAKGACADEGGELWNPTGDALEMMSQLEEVGITVPASGAWISDIYSGAESAQIGNTKTDGDGIIFFLLSALIFTEPGLSYEPPEAVNPFICQYPLRALYRRRSYKIG